MRTFVKKNEALKGEKTMTKKLILQHIFIGFIFVCLTASTAFAQTGAFTYQGKLTNNGTPATGTYEMRFTLFDLPAGGFEFGTPKTISNIVATNGVFTVVIPVGDWSFDQSERYMEIAVRPQGNVNPFTVLAPLQQITNSPKAIFANTAALAGFANTSGNTANLSGLGIEQFVLKNISGEIAMPRFENLAADPAPASASNIGRIYFNTATKSLMVSNGTAWANISVARTQVFTGDTGITTVPCFFNVQGLPLRTATFTKSLAATRLRITYRDTASATSADFFSLDISMRIDNVLVSNPTAWTLPFADESVNPSAPSHRLRSPFTTIGYINGVAAGTHTFTSAYLTADPATCSRRGSYLIEIKEIL
jgi:hypothetical protein